MGHLIASYRSDRARCLCSQQTKVLHWYWWTIRLVLLLSCLLAPARMAFPQTATEYQVKAAFLYNFTKFIEWPTSRFSGASDPFTYVFMGRIPLGTVWKTWLREKQL